MNELNPQRAFFNLFEELIKTSKIVEYYPFNQSIDFRAGDVVECSYMRGFFKVLSVNKSYLTIIPIEFDASDPKNFGFVGPVFLRKTELNQDVMRILFHATD